jgi:O-antigen ligase
MASFILGAGIFVLAPHVVFSRLSFSTEVREGKMEARAQLYSAALESFPDYALTGVGVGNFWDSWGFFNGFSIGPDVYGAHNVFFQIAIYWGIGALLALIIMLVQAYHCIPKGRTRDPLALCLLGLSVSLLLKMLVTHSLFAKQFSLGLGLLVAAQCWIWPHGIARISRSRLRDSSRL